MKILLLLFLLFTPLLQAQHSSDLEGRWAGTIEVEGEPLNIELLFGFDDGILDGTIDIPQQNAFNLPFDVSEATRDTVIFQFQTGTGEAVFYGGVNEAADKVTGDFEQAGMTFPFTINKVSSSNGINGERDDNEIIIPTRAGQISGSLLLQDEPSPLVILLSGSGSQDRDENIVGFRVFLELSNHLYNSGFSTFRYDDRGVGQSVGNADATLKELAEDLVDIVEYLKNSHADEFSKVILLGHSQGGMVATLAARQTKPSGIIFMGSPFISADKIIDQQIEAISEEQGISEDVVEVNLDFQSRIYEVVRENGSWDEIEADLAERLEYQINELPEPQREALGDMSSFIESQVNRQLARAKTRWFKSFLEFDMTEQIRHFDKPMLAIFGEHDLQVLLEPNRNSALGMSSEYDLDLQTVTIPNANHLFQYSETGLPSEYGMLDKEFTEGFIEAILTFLNDL